MVSHLRLRRDFGYIFIMSDRSRAICPGTVSFFYYVRAIHYAFFNKLEFHDADTDTDTDTDILARILARLSVRMRACAHVRVYCTR